MVDTVNGAEYVDVSDGVAGYLRDNPNGRERFFHLMAQKAAMEAPGDGAVTLPCRTDKAPRPG